jgi:hypothetical protein
VPRAELGGITFLPRSIDKVRAHLPGGNPGPYVLTGGTQMMLETLGIDAEAFRAAVAAATDDDEVVAFVHARTDATKIDRWNAFIAVREPHGGDRVGALTSYPWLVERPDLRSILDVLEEDDRRTYRIDR